MSSNVITDSDVENIEQSILEKLGVDPEKSTIELPGSEEKIKIEEAPQAPPQKKHTKNDLIEDIKKIEAENGGAVTDDKKLKRMTKQELEKHLAESISKKILPAVGLSGATDNSLAVRSLANFNLLAVHLLEQTSISFKDKTAGIPLLMGWTDKVRVMDKELNDVFRAILEKYGNSIQKYMDPLVQYFAIMTTSAGLVASENLKKKKEKSKEDS